MKRTYEMNISRVSIFTLFMLIGFLEGAPSRDRHHHHVGKSSVLKDGVTKQRSYIDIDASDPFKVPKSSHYINRPMPEFSQAKDDKEAENADEYHHERDRPEKALENIDDDVKGLDISSLKEGEKETKKQSHSDGEEERSNNEEPREEPREEREPQKEEKHVQQDESNNESSKEVELGQDSGKSLQNVEQDSQMKESLQNTDPGNDPEDGYKKNNVDANDLPEYRR